MTFKSLMGFGNAGKSPYPSIDRYHSGPGGYHHSYHGSYKKSGGSGAALSALTLLAFLFLINVMQQSLQENNSTSTATTALLLRDGELPVVLDTGDEKEGKKLGKNARESSYGTPAKSKDYVRISS